MKKFDRDTVGQDLLWMVLRPLVGAGGLFETTGVFTLALSKTRSADVSSLDVIDFWMDSGIPSEVTGSSPQVSPNGQANVCWIIRWPSKESREAGFAAFVKNPEWQDIWAKHPNPNAYLQMNVRFMEAAAY